MNIYNYKEILKFSVHSKGLHGHQISIHLWDEVEQQIHYKHVQLTNLQQMHLSINATNNLGCSLDKGGWYYLELKRYN